MDMKGVIVGIYIVLIVAGGLVGFIKANSKASIIMSSVFAVLLAISEFVLTQPNYLTNGLLIFLLIFFAVRYGKSQKFMPAGLMAVLTLVTLATRFMLS